MRQVWFENMVHANDYAGQQKAAMALHKLGKRGYTLWAIFSLYMCVKSGTASKTENVIFPQLASRFLESVKPFKNAQEAYLQALVMQVRNQKKELAEFLTSDQVKTWDFLDLNVLIPPALEDVEDWEGLKEHCKYYIVTKNRDDWNHWKALIKAHSQLGTLESAVEFATGFKKSRNSGLALVELASIGAATAPSLNDAVEAFFTTFGNKRSTYSDLAKYVVLESFDKARWLDFLSKQDSSDLNVNVNAETFRFLLRDKSYSVNELVKKQTQNYDGTKLALAAKDVKDYHPGDDYLLIAAYAILENSRDRLSLQKACILLELAAKHDKHQFYVRLWLVRIYLLLGAYTTARGHYKILKVSKIQNESLSHHFLTRLSSVWPDVEMLYDAFEIYETSNGELAHYLMASYQEGSYTQLESMNDLQRVIKNSVSRGIIQSEIGTAKRFQPNAAKGPVFSKLDVSSMADSRDFDIMRDVARPGETKLSAELSLGPRVGPNWVEVSQLKSEIVKHLVKGDAKLEELVKQLQATGQDELSATEQWAKKVIVALGQSALNKNNGKGYTAVSELLDEGKSLLQGQTASVDKSAWGYLHTSFGLLEVVIIVAGYVDLLSKHKSHVPFNQSAATSLRKALNEGLYTAIRDSAQDAKQGRSARTQQDLEALVPWAEKELGFTGVYANEVAHLVESVVEGSAAELDKSLTYLRSISI